MNDLNFAEKAFNVMFLAGILLENMDGLKNSQFYDKQLKEKINKVEKHLTVKLKQCRFTEIYAQMENFFHNCNTHTDKLLMLVKDWAPSDFIGFVQYFENYNQTDRSKQNLVITDVQKQLYNQVCETVKNYVPDAPEAMFNDIEKIMK